MAPITESPTNMLPSQTFPDYTDPYQKSNMTAISANPVANVKATEASRGPSPQPTHFSVPLQNGNGGNGHRILRSATVGYIAPEFTGKPEQKKTVKSIISAAGFVPEPQIDEQIEWFYEKLGIDDVYFELETPDVISSHITSLYAAKVASFAREDKQEEIRLDMEANDHAIYIDTSVAGKTNTAGPRYEERLEAKYIDHPGHSKYRVETFRSPAVVSPSSKATLRCYFVYQCQFATPPEQTDPKETNLELIADNGFLRKATDNTKQIYQDIIELAVNRAGPVIEVFDIENTDEKRMVVAFRSRTAQGLFSALSDLYHYYGVTSSRKYLEQFSNGITVMSVYLRPTSDTVESSGQFPSIEESIDQISKEVSLLYCLPHNKFHNLFLDGQLSLQESVYAHSAWVFVQHFLNRLGPEYSTLAELLDVKNNAQQALLSNLKRRLRSETFTPEYIYEIIQNYPGLVRALYASFANIHLVKDQEDPVKVVSSSLSVEVLSDDALKDKISKNVNNEHDEMVLTAFRVFNNAILKTNYFTPTKVALSFRLDPSFLPEVEYPKPLYGMFLVISSESRGFHLRFKDISRGGIRIVKSRNKEAYGINARSIFDENYGLASTQQRKNKDIPEGGSKGVILLDPKQQNRAREAFEKYIDSILDLLLPAETPGIKNPVVDLYGKEEIIFMGPDENTAELVDWATEHARSRGAPWWKSFFTGKSPKLGGIPHDTYGMTTLSVREYVKGIYRKLELDPSTIRKMQTGGPDGDLGSNEIKLGNEKYTAIVDGSGVLADPNGLDRDELLRLANGRKMIIEYDISKLSPEGYRVLCDDVNITLPNGEVINNGTSFRNTFHLRDTGSVDCFVPCGGRPASIDLISVNRLIKDGKCIIPYLVEGANLFITQEAKLRLEAAGCILYKDASANKGGVTSSSLEVLASLSFDDEGFVENMCHNAQGEAPQFYKDYVKQVQLKIQENARLEFEAIWREHEQTGTPRSILSDKLSVAITDLDEKLQHSDLWDNEKIRRSVLQDALPRLLLEKIGLDTLIARIPDSYLRSIFGSYLASRFVYEFGSSPSQFAFYDFMSKRMAQIAN
ncbi:Glutamate/Leucine/Phenylalanine/Valine dehydrogenase-domain-containing protein [Fusarium oxysporum II5]|uniref:NAD-specific glutamate dehydrogenase n=3 Tax=Fusarium oxysporum species complex TaxID=171631 RepID=X0JWK6_FUSO5|nr:NAD-specific glutamate dehydrogenase [Fusarium odoratissimum NRRL 54006]EXM05603.1 NAD-specific glutamate dehydrogenase [Fusarium odoratissimum NRRL 54006]KAH7214741.1 Glutamate/Leucine/Phenylalanine/Valine dehydrogenase-domain-containing protein [Fusarium oxysporum]KAK2126074.1 Glutamate/Leucine/Phenylalanine/Valine dehydrogenase-domain-containing protein [Fusarium oxysporum II5]